MQLISYQATQWLSEQTILLLIAYGLLLAAFILFRKNHHSGKCIKIEQHKCLKDTVAQLEQTIKESEKRQRQLISANQASYSELDLARQRADNADLLKSRFLADMSHEIRTPLNAIVGYTELLHFEQHANLSEYLNHIDSASQHLLELIDDILDLSQLESARYELHETYCDLPALVHDCCQMANSHNLNDALTLSIDIHENANFQLLIDAKRIRQIVINLVSNALKYTERGYVSVRVQLAVNATVTKLIINVSDTGPGMTEEQLNQITQPFQRFHSTRSGYGLGMAITQQLIHLMSGSIQFTSAVDQGTDVNVVIPLTEPPLIVSNSTQVEVPKIAEQSQPYAMKTQLDSPVLVVDDQALNRDLLKQLLAKLGHECICCESGMEAIQRYKERYFCLVLLDIRMPGLDGIETCQLMHQIEKQQGQIVAVTANAMPEDRTTALQAGFDHFLAKPIRLADLDTICKQVGIHKLASQNIAVTQLDRPDCWLALLDLTAGDETLALDLLEQLITALPTFIDQLEAKSYLNHNDYDLIHQWHGLFRCCCFDDMADSLQQLEVALYSADAHLEIASQQQLIADIREVFVATFHLLRIHTKGSMALEISNSTNEIKACKA